MGTKVLSDKQQLMLTFIKKFGKEHGFPPTVRDIALGCDISSTSVVAYNLQILENFGYISRFPHISRGIILKKEFDET